MFKTLKPLYDNTNNSIIVVNVIKKTGCHNIIKFIWIKLKLSKYTKHYYFYKNYETYLMNIIDE